jgi:hypothetical protein
MSADEVTESAYRASFERYAACLGEGGHGVVLVDDTGPVLSYRVPAEAVATGVEGRCYVAEFEALDVAWQRAHEDESAWADLLRKCLVDRGVEPGDTLAAMEFQREAIRLTPEACWSA